MGIFSKSIACIHIWSTDCRLQPPFFLHFVPIIFPLFHLSFLLLCIFQSNLSPNTPKFTPNLTVFLQQDSLLTYVLGLLYSNSFLSLFPAKKTAAKKSKAEKAELATHVVPPHTYSVPWPPFVPLHVLSSLSQFYKFPLPSSFSHCLKLKPHSLFSQK